MNESPIAAEEFAYGFDVAGLDMSSLGESLRAVVAEAMTDPARMSTWAADVMLADQTIGMNMLLRFMQEPAAPVAAPAAGDKRFADAAWSKNPLLAGMLEGYLVRARAALKLVEGTKLPEATRRKAKFALTMLTDAAAPSNIPWVNPSVVKEAYDTGGGSLMRGMQNYLEDTRSHGGKPRQVDSDSFVLGKNLAATPGRVVFRNELIELIAYQPQTARVHAVPLLCSPPWINKYYVMDLAPGRSFIEWAVQHQRTVFAISYRNPDPSMRGVTLDDYLIHGPREALDIIGDITRAPKIDITGLCLGGALTAMLAAYLAEKGDDRIGSVTLLNTLLDYSEPGVLGTFTDEKTVARLEQKMAAGGVLEGGQMAGTFDILRANDLIFNYVVSNWLMGQDPPAFDILAWNGDNTRMPAAMHSFYLRSLYMRNELARGELELAGQKLSLSAVTNDTYVVGAINDHIVPWHASYKTGGLVGGTVRYVLSSGGHIAGIVNPPGPKAWYEAAEYTGADAETWRRENSKHKGSWWEDWTAWSDARAGALVKPPPMGSKQNRAIADAPGDYVFG